MLGINLLKNFVFACLFVEHREYISIVFFFIDGLLITSRLQGGLFATGSGNANVEDSYVLLLAAAAAAAAYCCCCCRRRCCCCGAICIAAAAAGFTLSPISWRSGEMLERLFGQLGTWDAAIIVHDTQLHVLSAPGINLHLYLQLNPDRDVRCVCAPIECWCLLLLATCYLPAHVAAGIFFGTQFYVWGIIILSWTHVGTYICAALALRTPIKLSFYIDTHLALASLALKLCF